MPVNAATCPGSAPALAYQTVHQAGDALVMHRHQAAYASLVVAGSYVETSLDGPLECVPGTIVVHPPFHAHGDRFGRGGARTLNVDLAVPGDGDGARAWRVDDLRAAREVFLRVPGRLPELLAQATPLDASGMPRWQVAMVDAVRHGGAGLGEIARELGISPEHASRTLVRTHGMPPRALRLESRWRRALRMLEDDLPLAEVAAAAGFSDQSHLCRVTRANTGCTPGRLRRRIKYVQYSRGSVGVQ